MFLLAAALSGALAVGGARATTYGAEPPLEAALRHAQTVLAGYFTGESKEHKGVLEKVMNEQGEVFDDVVLYTAHEFAVTEVLAGEKPRERIAINVRGAVTLPGARRRVVIGVSPDEWSPTGGYTAVYSKFMPAESEAELDEARRLVKKLWAGVPADPQAVLDRLGEAEAARDGGRQLLQPSEPVRPEGDDPRPGEQPEFEADPEKGAAEPVLPTGRDVHGHEVDPYWRALEQAVLDLEISDAEAEALAAERDRQGLRAAALRAAHARALQLALGWAIEDGELDEVDAKRLTGLHAALARLGWAPGKYPG